MKASRACKSLTSVVILLLFRVTGDVGHAGISRPFYVKGRGLGESGAALSLLFLILLLGNRKRTATFWRMVS